MRKQLLQSLYISIRTGLLKSNKEAFILLSLIFLACTVNAQVTGDFRSKAAINGNWGDTLSWEIYNGSSWIDTSLVPGDSANVNVLIQDGTTIHLKKTPARAIGNLEVGQGASGILSFDSANANITVNGITTILSGGLINFTTTTTGTRTFTDLTINSSGTWSNTSSTVTIKGNLTNNGSFTSGTGIYTLSGAAKAIAGPITISNLTVTGTYTNTYAATVATSLAGGGTLTNAANAVLNLSGGTSITNLNCSANTPNKVIYSGTGAQTTKATTYYDVLISNATGIVSLGNGTTTILDTVTVNSGGTLNVASGTLALTGTLVNNGTVNASGTGSTIVFQGAAAQTLNGSITSNQVGNLTINNAAGVSIPASVQINRGITLTSGSLSDGGIITLGSGGGNPFTYVRGNGTIATSFVTNYGSGANNFTYSGTLAPQTIGSELPVTANSLTINDSLGVTLNASLTVVTLNLTSGILNSFPNLVSVTGTAVANVTGGSANAYVKGALSRAFPSSVSAGLVYTFPVGKNAYQLFELVSPVLNATGVLTVQAFDASSGGSAGFGIGSLNTNRYWSAATAPSTFITNTSVRLTEGTPGSANTIGQSSTVNGAYINVGGTFAGQTVLSGSVTPSLGYFALAAAGTLSAGTYTVGNASILHKLCDIAGLLNTITATGDLIFEMQSDYDGTTGEILPITFNQFATGGGDWTAIIRPATGVSAKTTSGDPGSGNGLINFNGADRIAFDGRAGGSGSSISWTFRNTRTGGSAGPAFSFTNDAQNNTLSYLQIEGQNSGSASGTILFGTSAGAAGNDFNTISYCTVRDRSDITGIPANAIYSHGTSGKENNNITISNNNLFNFSAVGVYVPATTSAGGSGNWTISDNSFYANYGPLGGQSAIYLVPGTFPGNGNNVITGNYIGGSAPACGGSPLTNYGGAAFNGIYLTVDTASPTSVQNNVIQNIDLRSTGGGSFAGISVNNGSVNIGTITGNVIGSSSTVSSIKVAGTSGSIGIYSSPASASAIENIANNVIGNINLSGISASESNIGIFADAGINTITGNSILNLNADNGNTGSSASSSVTGITVTSSSPNQVISQNIIHSLSNTHISAAVKITGINYAVNVTSGTNVISKNFIHNFSVLSSSSSAQLTGINAVTGAATYSNNMISLGFDAAGASLTITPVIIGIDKASTHNMSFYYNSVYIGGSNVGAGVTNTHAFRRTGIASTGDVVVNNIFMNARSNATTGGKHYAINLNATTRISSDFNVLYANGTGGTLGIVTAVDFSNLLLWQTTNLLDLNSVDGNPAFIAADGNSTTTNLHINNGVPSAVESRATPVSIADDIDGDVRHVSNPDIGADEGSFLILGLIHPAPTSTPFTISPNPARITTSIVFMSRNTGNYVVKMTDITGREVMISKLNKVMPGSNIIPIDISGLAKGLYLVSLVSENGVTDVSKLLVQ